MVADETLDEKREVAPLFACESCGRVYTVKRNGNLPDTCECGSEEEFTPIMDVGARDHANEVMDNFAEGFDE